MLGLGLTGEERVAGVASGAVYPVALQPIVRHLMVRRDELLCDVGAGLGGPAAFMAGILGVYAVAVEASAESCRQAVALFPQPDVVRAAAPAVPLRDGACAAVTLLGVVSLLEFLAPVVDEACRLLQSGGQVGVTDLFLTDGLVAVPPDRPTPSDRWMWS